MRVSSRDCQCDKCRIDRVLALRMARVAVQRGQWYCARRVRAIAAGRMEEATELGERLGFSKLELFAWEWALLAFGRVGLVKAIEVAGKPARSRVGVTVDMGAYRKVMPQWVALFRQMRAEKRTEWFGVNLEAVG